MAFSLSLTRTSLTGAEAGGAGAAPAGPGTAHCATHPSSRVGVRVVCRPAAAAAAVIAAPVDQEQVPEAAGGADAAAVASPDQLAPAITAAAAKGGAARQLFAASPQAAPPRAARKASLRLLPVEPPARCGTPSTPGGPWLPDGSPRLESPLHRLHSQWLRAAAGLEEGRAPRLAPAGTGGAYFLVDKAGAFVAVFKPVDEEPLAVNNPKGRRGSSGSVAAAGPPAAAAAASIAAPGPGADGGPWSLAALTAALRDAAAAAAAKGAAGALVGGAWGAAPGEGLRRGLRPGEGAVREVAAYLLDYNGFSGVPPTAMVRLELGGADAAAAADASAPAAVDAGGGGGGCAAAAKVGSLQAFVDAEADCEEMGVSGFPVPEVHKIAVLDLRLGNTDRHAANILARRGAGGAWELTPIDHGCCLPDSFEDLYFEWATWPQAQVPFDEPTRAYIAALDADRDAAALAAHGLELRPECVRALRVTTALLQKGAAAGLAPAQIAGIASRQSAAAPSPLERMHAAACAAASAPCDGAGANGAACAGVDEPAYLRRMAALLDSAVADAALDAPGALLL